MEDVLEKYLRFSGYDVNRVMNITDVGHLSSDADTGEDKMLSGAKREHKTVMEIAKFYTDAFFADCEKLNIKRPDVVEPATNCIDDFINMISVLLEKGYAYIAGGNVYFDTSKLDNYYVFGNMNEDDLSELMMSLMSHENASYDGNLKKLGYADLNVPGGINIYPKDFECKSQIVNILDQYNADMEAAGEDEKVITYTDLVGTLMSSVTDIVNIISYVLVAFVAISLVVSSIMIGVITYISVLERKKEIGILRAIGASKHNVSQVFNAETFIIGFCAGAMGIGITLLLLIPANSLIRSLADRPILAIKKR